MRDLAVAVEGQLNPIHLKGKCLNIGLEKAEQEEGLRNSDGVKDESGGVQEDLRFKDTIKIQARLAIFSLHVTKKLILTFHLTLIMKP